MLTLIAPVDRDGRLDAMFDGASWSCQTWLDILRKETSGGVIICPQELRDFLIRRDFEFPEHDYLICQDPNHVPVLLRSTWGMGITRVYGIGDAALYSAMSFHADRILLATTSVTSGSRDFYPSLKGWESGMSWFPEESAISKIEEYFQGDYL